LVALTGGVQSNSVNQHANHGRASNQHRHQPSADSKPLALILIQNQIERVARALEAANSKPQPRDDNGQRSAEAEEWGSKWAFGMLIIALLETVVTGVGGFLVYRTLLHTRRAANATADQVVVARDTAQRELRAWVDIEIEIGEEGFRSDSIGNSSLDFRFNCRNVGPTPAIGVRLFATVVQTNDAKNEISQLRDSMAKGARTAETQPIFPTTVRIMPMGFGWGPSVFAQPIMASNCPIFKVGLSYSTIFDGPNEPPHETIRMFGVTFKDGRGLGSKHAPVAPCDLKVFSIGDSDTAN
jgi:hypothetical protein